MFDPLAFCEKEDRPSDVSWVAVKPADLYPAMIARIQEVIRDEVRFPEELLGPQDGEAEPREAAKRYVREARKIPPTAWELALAGPQEDKEKRDLRRQALELARLWFTRALKTKINPVGLHILRDAFYRL